MEIEVTNDFKIVCSDGLNWQVWELKDVAVRKDGKPTGGHEDKWVPLNSFHSDPGRAVEWIMQYMSKTRSGDRRTMKAFVDEMRKLKDEFGEVARAYAEAKMAGTKATGLGEAGEADEAVHPVQVPRKRGRKGKASG